MKVFSDANKISLLGLLCLTILSCRNDELRMTVVSYDNHYPGGSVTADTLIQDSLIDSRTAIIDIYFCSREFRVPYYLPTGGIFKDSTKLKECDMSIYPQIVKCYTYDENNRVTTMSVNGSGTTETCNYTYDSLNRVATIECFATKYSISYNNIGLVTKLSENSGGSKRRLEFSYR